MSNTVRTAIEQLKNIQRGHFGLLKTDVFNSIQEVIENLESKSMLLIEWSTEDVISRAKDLQEWNPDEPHIIPTEEQAIEILSKMDNNHDCNYGITWDTIDCYIDQLNPENVDNILKDMKPETSVECCPHCDCKEFEVKLDKLYPCPDCGKPLKACNECQFDNQNCNGEDDVTECYFYNSDGTAKSV